MIPELGNAGQIRLSEEIQPDRTYRLDRERKRLKGYCSGLEAVRQAVYKILATERYEYVIYSWNYGIELKDLFGKPSTYVCPELEGRIREALMQDERIRSVDSFTFETGGRGKIKVNFTVHSIYGGIAAEKEVTY